MRPLVTLTDAEPAPELEVIHPAREQGQINGREAAGGGRTPNEALYTAVVEASLACVLDETQQERDRERSGENLIGFAEGWAEMMAVEPLQFLTRIQTARVLSLPRRWRMMWLSEHRRACRRWARAGGAISGRRPVLPEIP